ncbi:SAM-dependent methyltransferase [Streptomyces winkii]|uniref:SAM-dependent methyltransferase n=1 Tax=Streptomyces winkii TaxID=3051178 RepID=UPI0028D494AD|nr:SAM-dependent methyltransferase [Streptomyces sp. DSM 40971]
MARGGGQGGGRGSGGSAPPAPAEEPHRAHPARIHDYYLGGCHHSEADVRAAEAVATEVPAVRTAARANRDFMARAARWLAAERGVRQFLDIGSGLPTEPGLHQVVRTVSPEAKVVYSDSDPVVVRHAHAMLCPDGGGDAGGDGAADWNGTGGGDGSGDCAVDGRTAYVHADVTDPESILDAPGLSDTIDLGRPVALTLNDVFHFVGDEQHPYDIVRTLLGALPADSHLVLTHTTADFLDDAYAARAAAVLEHCAESGARLRPRTRREVARFFEALEMAEPGLVLPHRWRPDPETPTHLSGADVPSYAGVARKP